MLLLLVYLRKRDLLLPVTNLCTCAIETHYYVCTSAKETYYYLRKRDLLLLVYLRRIDPLLLVYLRKRDLLLPVTKGEVWGDVICSPARNRI